MHEVREPMVEGAQDYVRELIATNFAGTKLEATFDEDGNFEAGVRQVEQTKRLQFSAIAHAEVALDTIEADNSVTDPAGPTFYLFKLGKLNAIVQDRGYEGEPAFIDFVAPDRGLEVIAEEIAGNTTDGRGYKEVLEDFGFEHPMERDDVAAEAGDTNVKIWAIYEAGEIEHDDFVRMPNDEVEVFATFQDANDRIEAYKSGDDDAPNKPREEVGDLELLGYRIVKTDWT